MDLSPSDQLRFAAIVPPRAVWTSATVLIASLVVALAAPFESRGEDDVLSFESAPPTLIVLFDGTILRGEITEVPGGYQIVDSQIRQVLPFQLVRLVASSLEEAYIKQRDGMQKPIASEHITLARWCFDQNLYAQAAEQLAAALKLEPTRSEAHVMLRNLADLDPEQFGEFAGLVNPAASRRTVTTGELTAQGISLVTQAEFMRRVQPILSRRCGNARCHGTASENGLQLEHVSFGRRQQRLETEHNLAAVLKRVDPQRPEASRILTDTLGAGNPAHRNLFPGRAGAVQVENLRAWVRQAATDLQRGSPADSLWAEANPAGVVAADFQTDQPFGQDEGEQSNSGAIQTTGFEESRASDLESPLMIEIPRVPLRSPRGMPSGPTAPAGRAQSTPPAPQSSRQQPQAVDSMKLLREILDQDRPDAFDPDAFNRKVHGSGQP